MAAAKRSTTELPVIVAGGGIGGLAVAVTLGKSGYRVHVLEQARELSEIGAGIQLGPNAGRMLAKWGILDHLADDLVRPDELKMMDATIDMEIGVIPLGEDFIERFGGPYYVAHRGDLHKALHTVARSLDGVTIETRQTVNGYEQDEDSVSVYTTDGRRLEGRALIGADGLRSTVRERMLNDGPPDFVNHTTYRTLLDPEQMPADVAWNAATLWAGPGTHLVHYPLRGRRCYNIVATYCSDWRNEGWNEPGDKQELLYHFRRSAPRVRAVLEAGTSFRKWALADRKPAARWSAGRVTLLGDAAHPVLQYYAQGAAMALEDADCLAETLKMTQGNFAAAFSLYEVARRPRTTRLYHDSRYLGSVYHARGIRRLARNLMMRRLTPEAWYDRVAWIYEGP